MNKFTLCVVVFSAFLLSGCTSKKYEGQTAEEWFNDYNEAETKLETNSETYENIDPAIIELNKCVNSETENYKFAYDSCLKTNGDDGNYCYNQVTEMLGHISDIKAKCAAKYVRE